MSSTTAKETALDVLGGSPNEFANVLAEYGITPADITVPKPPTTLKQNLDQLCDLTYPIVDEFGNVIRCEKHSGPLLFLGKEGEYDGDAFEGYDGFYVYALLHPVKGKVVVTTGRREGEAEKPAHVKYLDTLSAGAVVHFATVKTSNGYRIFQMVPPQANPNGR